jgi:hypothetical protein
MALMISAVDVLAVPTAREADVALEATAKRLRDTVPLGAIGIGEEDCLVSLVARVQGPDSS